MGLMLFQQLSGINAVIFYTVSIFKMSGSTINNYLSTIIVGVVNLISTFLANVLIDRLGRKILLYVSSVLIVLSLVALGTFFYIKVRIATFTLLFCVFLSGSCFVRNSPVRLLFILVSSAFLNVFPLSPSARLPVYYCGFTFLNLRFSPICT